MELEFYILSSLRTFTENLILMQLIDTCHSFQSKLYEYMISAFKALESLEKKTTKQTSTTEKLQTIIAHCSLSRAQRKNNMK